MRTAVDHTITRATQGTGDADMNADWPELFEREGVQFAVLDPCDDGTLVEALRSHAAWTVDFADEEAVIFGRAAAT